MLSEDNLEEQDAEEAGGRYSLSPISTFSKPRRCRRFARNFGSLAANAFKHRDLLLSEEAARLNLDQEQFISQHGHLRSSQNSMHLTSRGPLSQSL